MAIADGLLAMSKKIPPDFNDWSSGMAIMFKDVCYRSIELATNKSATLDELVNQHWLLKGFWK